jgi:hypothetical protein
MILEMVAHRDPNVVAIKAFYGDDLKVNFFGKLATDPHVQVGSAGGGCSGGGSGSGEVLFLACCMDKCRIDAHATTLAHTAPPCCAQPM